MPIIIANHKVLEGMGKVAWHPILIRLANWCAHRYSHFRITCAWEKRDYFSVHDTNPLRGLDIGIKEYDDPQGVADDINQCWQYDERRPNLKCAVYGDEDHLDHCHLQCHYLTKIVNSPTCKIGNG